MWWNVNLSVFIPYERDKLGRTEDFDIFSFLLWKQKELCSLSFVLYSINLSNLLVISQQKAIDVVSNLHLGKENWGYLFICFIIISDTTD